MSVIGMLRGFGNVLRNGVPLLIHVPYAVTLRHEVEIGQDDRLEVTGKIYVNGPDVSLVGLGEPFGLQLDDGRIMNCLLTDANGTLARAEERSLWASGEPESAPVQEWRWLHEQPARPDGDAVVLRRHPAFDYARDDVRRRIQIRPHRSLSIEEYVAIIDQQAREGTWSYGLMWDLRAPGEPVLPIDTDLVAAHVYGHLVRHGSRGPVAVLTHSTDVESVAASYASKTSPAGVLLKTFHDSAEAEQWLAQEAVPGTLQQKLDQE